MTVVQKSDAFAATTIRTHTVHRVEASPAAAAAMQCSAADFQVRSPPPPSSREKGHGSPPSLQNGGTVL